MFFLLLSDRIKSYLKLIYSKHYSGLEKLKERGLDVEGQGSSHHIDPSVTTVTFQLRGSIHSKDLDVFIQVSHAIILSHSFKH